MQKILVEALLFDVGGVLIDFSFERALQHWSRASRIPVPQLAERFRPDGSYEAFERGELSAAQYFAALRSALGVSLPDQELQAGWCSIFTGVIPGAVELLTSLSAGAPVYLFSNTNAAHYEFWGGEYPELLAPVKQIFCSHELGLRKPSAAAFEKVCSLIGVAPGRIAFFDDLRENVDGATRAGLRAFHVGTIDSIRDAVSDRLLLGSGL
jgi:FMN phosphatase YigB (HAD superfamily)